MSLKIEDKKAIVEEVGAQLKDAESLVIAQYRGMKVTSLTALRAQARQADIYLRVLKNNLAKRAVQGTVFEPLADQMVGPLIYAASKNPVRAAKVLHQLSKKEEALIVKSGFYDGKVLTPSEITQLALIPSREELLAKVVGMMQAPLATFARTLAALSEKKSAQAQA